MKTVNGGMGTAPSYTVWSQYLPSTQLYPPSQLTQRADASINSGSLGDDWNFNLVVSLISRKTDLILMISAITENPQSTDAKKHYIIHQTPLCRSQISSFIKPV